MRFSENMLLQGYAGVTWSLNIRSIIEGVDVWWSYCDEYGDKRTHRGKENRVDGAWTIWAQYTDKRGFGRTRQVKLAKRLNESERKTLQEIGDTYEAVYAKYEEE